MSRLAVENNNSNTGVTACRLDMEDNNNNIISNNISNKNNSTGVNACGLDVEDNSNTGVTVRD